jgi:hypothetical protein
MVHLRAAVSWLLTAATYGTAATAAEMVEPLCAMLRSERAGRPIDGEGDGSMERRRREGNT